MVLLLFTAAGVALALFAYENPATITVYFGPWAWERVPVWYPVTAGALAACATCMLWMLAARYRRRLAARLTAQYETRYEALVVEHDWAIAELKLETRRLREQTARRRGEAERRAADAAIEAVGGGLVAGAQPLPASNGAL